MTYLRCFIQQLTYHPYILPNYLQVSFFISDIGTHVGFTVGVSYGKSSWSKSILKFNHVVTNTGNGYSTITGKFTAPRDGTYVFFLTVVSYYKNGIELDIVHDNVKKVKTHSSSSASYQTGTNMVVLVLDKGDSVWVARFSGSGYHGWAVPITSFSGFLL